MRSAYDQFMTMIGKITAVAFPLSIVVGVAVIIKAGYGLISSEGNPAKVKEAQADLVAAITGVLFVVLSLGILNIIMGSLLGL
ncbi:hypothetical protein JXA34_03625 [Patescibacteria group bacterium]|nr:hypothetical protein [Patescibacteria group bacterium]